MFFLYLYLYLGQRPSSSMSVLAGRAVGRKDGLSQISLANWPCAEQFSPAEFEHRTTFGVGTPIDSLT